MAPLSVWMALVLASGSTYALSSTNGHQATTLLTRQSGITTSRTTSASSAPRTTSAPSVLRGNFSVVCTEGNNDLMGMNNEPSSWCFCNMFGPFSALNNSTTKYCDYKTIPTQTISLTSHTTITNTACTFTTTTGNWPDPTPTKDVYCQCGETMANIQIATSSASTTSYCAESITAPPPGFTNLAHVAYGVPSWQARDCRSPYYSDTTKDPKSRWSYMYADDAYTDAVAYWNANQNTGLSFIQTLSKFFNGPQDIQCGTVAVKNSCVSGTACQNGYFAAGWMVMESLRLISDMNVNFYGALNNAEGHLTPDMGQFSAQFAPIDDSSQVLKTIISFVSLGAGLALGPIWTNVMLKMPAAIKDSVGLAAIKDTLGPVVIASTAITKDNTAAETSITTTNTLEVNMDAMATVWQHTVDTLNTNMFNGSEASIEQLRGMIADGKMLTGDVAISDVDAQGPIQKTIYGYMIPQAWALSNTNVKPVIIDTGVACDQTPNLKHTQGSPLRGCADNKLYFIVSVSGPSVSCTATMFQSCDDNPFANVPGSSALDGKKWGGVTGDDFVKSAVAGKAGNGGKNGWQLIDPAVAINTQSELLLGGNGIDLPGVTQIPICSEDEIFKNWNEGHIGANYPCN